MSTADNLDLVMERKKNLEDKLANLRKSIVAGIDGMERSKEVRDRRRKECVLKVMKMILANLEAQDKEVMSQMKSEAFDLLRVCNKSEAELDELSSALSNSEEDISHDVLSYIQDLDRKVDGLGIQKFVGSLKLAVDSDSFDSASLMETMRDAVYLKTPSVRPRSFSLVIHENSCSGQPLDILKLEVHVNEEGLTFDPFILKRLMFSVGFTDLENGSLWDKAGEISANGQIFTFSMRKRRDMTCRLSVKFLSSNISRSPQLLQAVPVEVEAVQPDPFQLSRQFGQKLARSVSEDSSTALNPPQKTPRLEEGGFQATSSSAMECEVILVTAGEAGSEVIFLKNIVKLSSFMFDI